MGKIGAECTGEVELFKLIDNWDTEACKKYAKWMANQAKLFNSRPINYTFNWDEEFNSKKGLQIKSEDLEYKPLALSDVGLGDLPDIEADTDDKADIDSSLELNEQLRKAQENFTSYVKEQSSFYLDNGELEGDDVLWTD